MSKKTIKQSVDVLDSLISGESDGAKKITEPREAFDLAMEITEMLRTRVGDQGIADEVLVLAERIFLGWPIASPE